MDAINKERRDIKVCSNRTAERQLKGGTRGGDGQMGSHHFLALTPACRRFTAHAGGRQQVALLLQYG